MHCLLGAVAVAALTSQEESIALSDRRLTEEDVFTWLHQRCIREHRAWGRVSTLHGGRSPALASTFPPWRRSDPSMDAVAALTAQCRERKFSDDHHGGIDVTGERGADKEESAHDRFGSIVRLKSAGIFYKKLHLYQDT